MARVARSVFLFALAFVLSALLFSRAASAAESSNAANANPAGSTPGPGLTDEQVGKTGRTCLFAPSLLTNYSHFILLQLETIQKKSQHYKFEAEISRVLDIIIKCV